MKTVFIKSLCLILLILAAGTTDAQNFEVNGIYYNVLSEDNDGGTVEVTYKDGMYGGYAGDIVIPAEVSHDGGTYRVTTIGDYAFSNCGALTSVSMPEVTTIGGWAFSWCSTLTSVDMPSVTTIDDRAFYECRSLISVNMPMVMTIDNFAFSDCEALASVNMPSVTAIGENVFSYCALTLVDIPASCTSIGSNPFERCYSLQEIIVDDNNPNYTSLGGVLYDKYMNTLIACPGSRSSIDVPSSVTTISNDAFGGCSALTSVTMPSVTTIGDYAFDFCSALISVTMPSVTTIGDYAFDFCSALISVDMPVVTTIGEKAFGFCDSLTSVSMPSVTTIGEYAFGSCDALTSVSMPSVITIGDEAFSCCSALASVSMPSVITIGGDAFYLCYALTSVDIPASCTSINGNPFASCTALKEITVDENNLNFSSQGGVLYDKYMNTLIACPGSKSSIDVPSSVTMIGDRAFYYCDALRSVNMPSVTMIGAEAFYWCALTSVSMPAVTTIGESAFRCCTILTSIDMPSVTTIGDRAFELCRLISVDIPASVTMIGNGAFSLCNALTSVYCRWEEPLECDPRFENTVLETATLYVPTGTIDAYRSVSPWSGFINIVERDYSGIADATAPEVVIKVIDGAISIEGGDGTASAPVVEVYSAGGQCVYRGTDSSIGGLGHGIYVVKVGGTVQKVAL